jgi:hypothetical protein
MSAQTNNAGSGVERSCVWFSVGVWLSDDTRGYHSTLEALEKHIEAFKHHKVTHIEPCGEIINVAKLGE